MSSKDITKKEYEQEILQRFLESDAGKKWLKEYDIVESSYKPNETPDFIFLSTAGKKIGLEIVRFIAKTKNGNATQILKTIVNGACTYAKKEYGLILNITITPYDYRKFSPNWNDHVDLCYNPGFSKKFNKNDLQPKLQKIIDSSIEVLKKDRLVTEWIESYGESLKIDINTVLKPYCCVNNAGFCKRDPFEDIQHEIDKKNKKMADYLKVCDECHLLVVISSSEDGSYCWFTKDIDESLFSHKFKSLQFYKAHFNLFDLYGVYPKDQN